MRLRQNRHGNDLPVQIIDGLFDFAVSQSLLHTRRIQQIPAQLGSSLQLRYTPELVFELDDSLKYGAHMFDLLSKLEAEQKEKAGETGNDEA